MKKLMKATLFLLIGAFLFANGAAQAQNRVQKAVIAEAEKISADKFGFDTKTANGARVYGVKKPSKKMLEAIDKGLDDLFAVARKNGYRKQLNYADYTIFIGKADRTKDFQNKYSPDIAVGAEQYAGTIYDKGGYIYAAGIVVALNPSTFLIAEHDKNYERVSEVVRYEGEHLVLYHNDRKRFDETRDHSKGGGHPILQ